MFKLNVAVIEDHDALRFGLVNALATAGYQAMGFIQAEDLALYDEAFDIYVIDMNLPGENGLTLTRKLRTLYPNSAIIMMTGNSQTHDKVNGYASGADIYLTKPFDAAELIAAMAAAQRKYKSNHPSSPLLATQVRIDIGRLVLIGSSGECGLSAIEADALLKLSIAPQKRLTVNELLNIASGSGETPSVTALKIRMSRLRRKLESVGCDTRAIQSVRGQGYQLCLDIIEN